MSKPLQAKSPSSPRQSWHRCGHCRHLAAQGATVIGTATSTSGAAAIGERLAAHGGHGRELDVTDAAAVDGLIDAVGKEFGAISILVNNAGITRDNLLMRMKDDDWQAIIDTNLTSVFRTSKAVMRGMMKARKGRIINIASVVGVTGNPGQTNYAPPRPASSRSPNRWPRKSARAG